MNQHNGTFKDISKQARSRDPDPKLAVAWLSAIYSTMAARNRRRESEGRAYDPAAGRLARITGSAFNLKAPRAIGSR